ncbi:hypothetical protein SAMN04487968_112133 [Nocardioides terrae]|uniref:FHA domain-containing protein n=1 Tax=Nocardioides terrae TaxID=574651 RepID=A0A1I1MVJ6_9ACTN|nr:FHA domain-containing protein [Nocardioides terrae]SFC85580.1 hypothetical protein SAMN04487968_112133 [Nocardioides terrae]
MSTRYVPGSAAILVGDRGLVATARENADGLIALVDSDLVVLTVIDSLSHGSLAKLPDFACAVVDGADLRIVVRGGFVARVGSESWTGEGVATWLEHTVSGGAGSVVVIETADGEDGPELLVTSGIVLASRATWTSVGSGGPTQAPAPRAEEPEAPPAASAFPPAPPTFPPPSFPPPQGTEPAESVPPLDSEVTVTESDLEFDAMFGATIMGRRPEDAAVREEVAEDGVDATGLPPALPAVPPPPPLAPTLPPPPTSPPPTSPPASLAGDHDGRTITAAQLQALREQAGVQGHRATPQAAVVLPDGSRHPVEPRLLIGRRPQARQVATSDVPTLVSVDDPYVSSTHLEAALVDGRVVVTDLSTNGTLVTAPGQAPDQLVKGVPTEVVDGTRLSLSDELTVTIELKAGG